MAEYTQLYINNDMSKLNTVLQTLVTNGIVSQVRMENYPVGSNYYLFNFYAAEGASRCFMLQQVDGSSGQSKFFMQAYLKDGTTLGVSAATSTGGTYSGFSIMYGYATASGVLIMIDSVNLSGNGLWLCITKNQNGDPTFIWTNRANANDNITTNMNTEYIVASSDVAPLSTVSRLAPTVRDQVVISPFFSCSAVGETSYTPDAGRVIAGNMNQFIYDQTAHEITFDGATWLTNGYWVLKVGTAS